MAKINEDTVVIKVSELLKDSDSTTHIFSITHPLLFENACSDQPISEELVFRLIDNSNSSSSSAAAEETNKAIIDTFYESK